MPRTIRAHVQVDRLPDVDSFVMFGLRVSAAVVPAVTGAPPVVDGAQTADADRILPWRWRRADGSPWTPHDVAAWKVYHFRFVDQTLHLIGAQHLHVLDPAAAGVGTFDPKAPPSLPKPRFRTRVDDEIAEVIKAFGPRQALEIPAQGNVVSGRTVYGLVESLTSLPNPIPAAMKVWTAIWVDRVNLDQFDDDEDRLVAVPVFAFADTSYDPGPPVLSDSLWRATMVKTPVLADRLDAEAHVHASLPKSQLKIVDNPERLIDLARLTVRAPAAKTFEGGDWIAAVGTRLAEAVDPAARAMAVLDKTIADVVQGEAATNDSTTRQALIKDMTTEDPDPNVAPHDLFRSALRELHRPVVTPRSRRSPGAMAPAAAFLEALAVRTPQLWPSVIPYLLAHAGAEPRGTTPDASTPAFDATSCDRLLSAAGVPPSPERRTADGRNNPSVAGRDRLPALDVEAEFVDWLVRHWMSFPEPVESSGYRHFEATIPRLQRGSPTKWTKVTFAQVGVVDFERVRASGGAVHLLFEAVPQVTQLPCHATVQWRNPNPDATRPGSEVKVELVFDAGKTSLAVDGVAVGDVASQLGNGRLSFEVLPADDSTLEITYTQGGLSQSKTVPAARAGRIGIAVHTDRTVKVGIDRAAGTTPAIDRERLVPQARALRAGLSWAYSAALVPELLKGWAPVDGDLVTATFEREPLAIRVAKAADIFIRRSFEKAFEDASPTLWDDVNPHPLRRLYLKLLDAAIDDGQRLARSIVPPALGDADRVTGDALPLAFLVSQLQDFDDRDDLWGRLAGVGVLISRDKELASDEWWSLNAASLHVAIPGANGRQPLTEDTAVLTGASTTPQPWKMASKVDPVPLSVGDVGGVRSALVKYENHSIVGEVEGAPQLDPIGRPSGPRRPEAFLFPPTNFVKMPALTFGRKYGILPYLIGHGGALPLALRADPLVPVKLKPPVTADRIKVIRAELGDPGEDYVHVRETVYPRTVPVSAPRVSEAQWPGSFPGVDPVVDELPLRLVSVTLEQGAVARFFRDQERLNGLLSGRDEAIRIEIGEIVAANEAATSLRLKVETRGDDAITEVASVVIALSALRTAVGAGELGLRVEMGIGTLPQIWALKRREHLHADDEPKPFPVSLPAGTPPLAVAVNLWSSAYLVVEAIGGDFDYEPPTIQWGSQGPGNTLVLAGDRPLLPPELAHGLRKVAVLDGIRIGAPTGRKAVKLDLRRPAVPVATHERWINGPTGGQGAGDKPTIQRAIDAARLQATALHTGDRSLDDPATEAIFAEVVQIFPRRVGRRIDGATKPGPFLLSRLDATDLSAVLGVKRKLPNSTTDLRLVMTSPIQATVVAEVDLNRLPNVAQDTLSVGELKDKRLTLKLAPGCAYEIRLYAGIPAEQKDLFNAGTASRFSPAVRASWRRVKVGSEVWQLGTPLTLTVEVATEIMPEPWPPRKGATEAFDFDFDRPAFALDVARPPSVTEEQALVRLVPENLGWPVINGKEHKNLHYPAARYVNRAALLSQRWSWRGRPHPELTVDTKALVVKGFGTKGEPIEPGLGKFVDAAFVGRAADDVGAVREAGFGRRHALGGQPTVPDPGDSTLGERPVLLEHDLDRRFGVHLWRFALRLKSRYAAMRTNHPDLLRFSHQPRGGEGIHWWNVMVPDRVYANRSPRLLNRPNLMLVLPLTESLMDTGTVPPLLAIFNEELFLQFNAADGIEAVIDVARHPFPGLERIDRDKSPGLEPSKTFGELFDGMWEKVATAREALAAAVAAYTASVGLESSATAAEQAKAQKVLYEAQKTVEQMELRFKEVQTQAEAWGVVKRWNSILAKLKNDISNTTDKNVKQRLEKRKEEIEKTLLPAAQSAAEKLEQAPVVEAGTPIDPTIKHFQEISPDTMREAKPMDRPVAIRVDGPIGYTFDADVDAGRFGHAAVLVSPVAEAVRPGSFVRLRFRRRETPGVIVAPPPPPPTPNPPPAPPPATSPPPDQWPDEPPATLDPLLDALPVDGVRFLLARGRADAIGTDPDGHPLVDTTVHRFDTVYEGLAFDIADLAAVAATPLGVRFELVPPVGGQADEMNGTTVHAEVKGGRVFVWASTPQGDSAKWSLPLSEKAVVQMQMMVSLRPKPDTGPDADTTGYTPAGDVSVSVRITPDDNDRIKRQHEGVWLSVLCMPLNCPPLSADEKKKFASFVAVRVCPTGSQLKPLPIAIAPLRLSDFAPAVWCQFAAAMSRFEVDALTSQRRIIDLLPVSVLTVKLVEATQTFTMGLTGLRDGESLVSLSLRTENRPDDSAQVEETIYAVVTRYVYDAFDILRERAVGIHPLDRDRSSPLSFGPRIWPTPGDAQERERYTTAMRGRVRFLRVVRGKVREEGGFVPQLQEFPLDFFGKLPDETLDAEPFDAAGMAMGISAPMEWDGSN